MGLLRNFIDDFQAWRRGEVRVAPRGQTGRVYAKKDQQSDSLEVSAKAKPRLTMKITRADGTVEVHEAPVELIKVD